MGRRPHLEQHFRIVRSRVRKRLESVLDTADGSAEKRPTVLISDAAVVDHAPDVLHDTRDAYRRAGSGS